MLEEHDMADVKKEQKRDELHRAIWAIADELRGAVKEDKSAQHIRVLNPIFAWRLSRWRSFTIRSSKSR